MIKKILVGDHEINNIKSILFDKDGTIIDLHHYWTSMLKIRAKVLLDSLGSSSNDDHLFELLVSSMGMDLLRNKIKPEGPVGIKPRIVIEETATTTINDYGFSIRLDDVKKAFNEADEISMSYLNEFIRPLPNVFSLLKILYQEGIKLGIITSDLSTRAALALDLLGIREYFSLILGADSVVNPKPDPEMIEICTREFGITTAEIIVVGDSMSDLKLAINGGTHFIGVRTGLASVPFINEAPILVENLKGIRVIV